MTGADAGRRGAALTALLLLGPILVGAHVLNGSVQKHAWWPDEQVYVSTAARLALFGRVTFPPSEDVQPVIAFYTPVEGGYAPYYPPGYPAVLALLYRLVSPDACYRASAMFALAGVVVTLAVAWRMLDGLTALVAASLLAVNPAYLLAANGVMSDVPAAVLVAGAALCSVVADGSRERWRFLLANAGAGLLCGAAMVVHLSACVGVAAGGWAALFGIRQSSGERPSRRASGLAAYAVGFGIAASVLAAYQWRLFGSLGSPYMNVTGEAFHVKHVMVNLPGMVEALLSLRSGGLLLPACAGLLLMARRWRAAGFLASWALPILLLHLFYASKAKGVGYLRFVVIAVIPLALLAAHAVVALGASAALALGRGEQSERRRRVVASIVIAAIVVGWCSVEATNAKRVLKMRAEKRLHLEWQDVAEVISSLVPPGATVMGPRTWLGAMVFHRYGRNEVVVVNQLGRKGPNSFSVGEGDIWRGNMTTLAGGIRELERANRSRIAARLKEGRRVFVVDHPKALRGLNGKAKLFRYVRVGAKGGIAVAEVQLKGTGNEAPPASSPGEDGGGTPGPEPLSPSPSGAGL